MAPPTALPSEYDELAAEITRTEKDLGLPGKPIAVPIMIAAELAKHALHAWLNDGGIAANELRVRANIIHGLAHAYSPQPNWLRAIRVGSIGIDFVTPAPRSIVPGTLRLYALGSVNTLVMQLLAGPTYRVEAWKQACVAEEYFDQIDPAGIWHWKGVLYTALAFMGLRHRQLTPPLVRKYATGALEFLDDRSELRYLADHLLGNGNGLIPGSGLLGTALGVRRAAFSVADLYRFNAAPNS